MAPTSEVRGIELKGEARIRDPQEVRDLARECRRRVKTAIEPDVIDHCDFGRSSWPMKRTT
jgi:hypothetical protein